MKIAILHNAVVDSDSLADRDVLVQVAAVEQALQASKYATRRIACTLNLEAAEEALINYRPDVVFNLVESLGGSDRLAHLAPALLDDLDLPYAGTSAAALHVTNNKPLTKHRLRAAGLPTPDWTLTRNLASGSAPPTDKLSPPYIIKAVWEHASVGLDDHALITTGDGSTIIDQIESRSRQLGRPCFAEQFIPGREFNLSLIAASEGSRVLPPAEIDFSAFPLGKPRIVGYAAKWVERSIEYDTTPRKFNFVPADAPLLDWLHALAVDCWRLFDLAGYARIDFRVDSNGQPWILEINANPCLSPDAGFAAALAQDRLPLARAVEWIVEDALRRQGTVVVGQTHKPEAQARVQGSGFRIQEDAKSKIQNRKSASTPHSALRAPHLPQIKLRTEVLPSDRNDVRRIVESTALFRPAEIDVAVELVDARLEKGDLSGYEFVFAELNRQVAGYVCFGKNTLTVSSHDVYWIAVEPSKQGAGLGRLLLEQAERQIAVSGGTRIYIETSHRADYQATRGFYERCGYALATVLEDFYAPGDGKATYVKVLEARVNPHSLRPPSDSPSSKRG